MASNRVNAACVPSVRKKMIRGDTTSVTPTTLCQCQTAWRAHHYITLKMMEKVKHVSLFRSHSLIPLLLIRSFKYFLLLLLLLLYLLLMMMMMMMMIRNHSSYESEMRVNHYLEPMWLCHDTCPVSVVFFFFFFWFDALSLVFYYVCRMWTEG